MYENKTTENAVQPSGRVSIPQRAGAVGKALIAYLATGSLGLALVVYLLATGAGC